MSEQASGGGLGGGQPGGLPGTARLTPYELAFMEGDFETRVFPGIQAEAEEHREDPSRRSRFAFLSLAGDAVREMVPPDAPPDMLAEYRALLYHAFNFWRYGRRLYLLDAPVARYLVEGAPTLEGWDLAAPLPSVYLQLPANLFWASISTDVPPEPVDGFFVTVGDRTDAGDEAYQELQVLMVLGIRRERPGFSVIAFETEAGPGIPTVWVETPGREEGHDFENVLPGGEIAGLYSILTTAEALKLVARALWYIDRHAEDVTQAPAPERRASDRPGSVPLSRIDFHQVRFPAAGNGSGA
ncbi:MAG TPA: hypothetical protein VFQ45_05275 [Longimicrobium sp.]|nr:hypothetical protein [Longimicrobium sp.]